MTSASSPTEADAAGGPSYNSSEALAGALEEPTLVVGILRFRGRILSIEEWLPFFERQVALEKLIADGPKGGRGAAEILRASLALWIDYLRAVFPRRRYNWFAPDPVDQLRKAPGAALREAYYRFFFLQARAIGWDVASLETPPATPGISSPASTPAAAAAGV